VGVVGHGHSNNRGSVHRTRRSNRCIEYARVNKERREALVLEIFQRNEKLFNEVASMARSHHELSNEEREAVRRLLNTIESIAIYSKTRRLDQDILDRTINGYIPELWRILRQEILRRRLERTNPHLWESTEELVRRLFPFLKA
jgi:hypothetical protein